MLIKIQRFLMQPHPWRFIGFMSSIIGLLCYAMSSSFNHMFGQWNLFKIFLYIALSSIICVAILFARLWQHSNNNNLQFKAHMAFLVLSITSGYSFFFDKTAINQKLDVYGLISCVAFAVMSFGLSRQIRCGFEVDMMYFFLGALIVQLMKTRLWFGVFGVGFSYFLIVLRSSLDSSLDDLYLDLQDQHNLVIHVDSPQQSNTLHSVPSTLQQANDGVLQNSLSTSIRYELQLANWRLLEVLWTHLNEFLKDNKDNHIPVSLVNNHNLFMEALPSQEIKNLHEKVKIMMANRFDNECLDQYNGWRREFLEMCFTMLRLKDNDDENENERIKKWMKCSNIVMTIVLPNEQRLCDQVFSGFSSIADISFMKLYSEVTTTLIHDFAAGFADYERRSPDLSPEILNVFRTLHDLIPECPAPQWNSVSLSHEAITIKKTLEEIVPKNGTYYTFPAQVMNHLNGVLEVEDTLQLVKNINFKFYGEVL